MGDSASSPIALPCMYCDLPQGRQEVAALFSEAERAQTRVMVMQDPSNSNFNPHRPSESKPRSMCK
jgi:hypothetical protein